MDDSGMIIAIDYDGTYARDPVMWSAFVELAKERGHQCVMVTGRSDDGLLGDQVKRAVAGIMPVVFAGSEWKIEAARRRGWVPDIWVDDNPQYIGPQILIAGKP